MDKADLFEKSQPEGILAHPPMGWNSWDCYGSSITEAEFMQNAAFMAEHLLAYGWNYAVVDIQWYQATAEGWEYKPFADLCLNEYGLPQPAVNRFPSAAGGKGFKPLADRVHALGLKFGLHIMRGIPRQAVSQDLPVAGTDGIRARQIADFASVCRWNPDMYGLKMEADGAQAWYDALYRQFADWGVDFVKVDDCAWNFVAPEHYPAAEVEAIARAIKNSGRDMVLSLSPGPAVFEKREHLTRFAHMWRMTDDFWDRWDLLLQDLERCREWQAVVGPGCWPDADMLPLGRLNMRDHQGQGRRSAFTEAEQQTLMNLWCLFRSPLMYGGDLPRATRQDIRLLQNRELLAVSQQGGWPRDCQASEPGLSAWTQLDCQAGQPQPFLFINTTDQPLLLSLDFSRQDRAWGRAVKAAAAGSATGGTCRWHEVWQEQEALQINEASHSQFTLAPHASRLYLLEKPE
ncbi:glycoside hydrolase family 27 protein [Oscillospiraceae bacterium HV4-5-C5C]|nr:glycoside hydrolase family 27 protein [Oscillospiraceae bacterium HV4-5-C5C]